MFLVYTMKYRIFTCLHVSQARCAHDILRQNGTHMEEFYTNLLNQYQTIYDKAQDILNATQSIVSQGAPQFDTGIHSVFIDSLINIRCRYSLYTFT